MKKFNYIFDAFQDLFVGLAVTTTVTLLLGGFVDIWHFLLDVLIAFAINYVAGLIIPTRKIAEFFAKIMKLSTEKKGFIFLQVFVNTVIFVTVISVSMFIIKAGFTMAVFELLKRTYLILLVVAYVVGFAMAPISGMIAGKIVGEKKN